MHATKKKRFAAKIKDEDKDDGTKDILIEYKHQVEAKVAQY